MVETALTLRALLEEKGLKPWAKLTGGKGLHLMVPIAREIDHDEAREYAKARWRKGWPRPHPSASPSRSRHYGARGGSSSIISGTAAAIRRSRLVPAHQTRLPDRRSGQVARHRERNTAGRLQPDTAAPALALTTRPAPAKSVRRTPHQPPPSACIRDHGGPLEQTRLNRI